MLGALRNVEKFWLSNTRQQLNRIFAWPLTWPVCLPFTRVLYEASSNGTCASDANSTPRSNKMVQLAFLLEFDWNFEKMWNVYNYQIRQNLNMNCLKLNLIMCNNCLDVTLWLSEILLILVLTHFFIFPKGTLYFLSR